MLDDAGLQAECNHLTIAQLPDFLTWIPLATGLLHPLSEIDFRKANTQGDSLVSWYLRYWRFPGPLVRPGAPPLGRLFFLPLRPPTQKRQQLPRPPGEPVWSLPV